MPSADFIIRVVTPIDGASIDKFRNFGEELMVTMRRRALGDVSDADSARDELSVTLRSRRHVGQVRTLIRKLLASHFLDRDTIVTEI
jgi:hypothetical protein